MPEHGLRLEIAIERLDRLRPWRNRFRKVKSARREELRQADARQLLDAKLGALLRGEGVDLLFGNEEHHLVPAAEQHFAHGEAGEEMPAGAAGCDDEALPFTFTIYQLACRRGT